MQKGSIMVEPDDSRISEFIDKFKDLRDVQFSTVPYPLDSHEGIAYLLMVASINQGIAAERIRDLVRALYDLLGGSLLNIHQVPVSDYLHILQEYKQGWKIWQNLPDILCSVSRFAEIAQKNGGLVERGRAQADVHQAVEKISTKIFFMGKDPNGAKKKAWMFMRWMVRPFPDIGVWNPPLRKDELKIPLDVNTGKAFLELLKVKSFQERKKELKLDFDFDDGALASTKKNVDNVTEIAKWIDSEDPSRLDYPFFCFGRRFNRGMDQHRCWSMVKCSQCSMKSLIHCPGK